MSDILLSALPFTGHVSPICAVAEALVARGHDVRVYTGGTFRDRVEQAGAALVPWRTAPDFDENDLGATFPGIAGSRGPRQVFRNILDCIIGTAAAQVADLDGEWRRRPWQAVAADEMSLGAALSAERHRVPWTTISVLPLGLASPDGPPAGLGLAPGRTAAGRLRDAGLRAAVPALALPLTRALDRQRTAAGLTRARRGFAHALFSPTSIVATGAAALDYGRVRPTRVAFVGALTGTAPAMPLPEWWADLDGRRVVHVTQGTQNVDPTDLIAPALAALADEDVLVVVATGRLGEDRLPFPVPANARVAGLLPYDRLLPRVSAMITNGGWGGTVAALGHGVPLVVAGADYDKPDIARRVAWSGAGIDLFTATPRAERLREAYGRLIAEPRFGEAAARIGADIRAGGGAARAAELIAATF